MNTKKVDWKTFMDLTDEFDYETISRNYWRHGTEDTIVFEDNDKLFWKATIRNHSDDGWQKEYDVILVQVHQVPKTVLVWTPVENSSSATQENK